MLPSFQALLLAYYDNAGALLSMNRAYFAASLTATTEGCVSVRRQGTALKSVAAIAMRHLSSSVNSDMNMLRCSVGWEFYKRSRLDFSIDSNRHVTRSEAIGVLDANRQIAI